MSAVKIVDMRIGVSGKIATPTHKGVLTCKMGIYLVDVAPQTSSPPAAIDEFVHQATQNEEHLEHNASPSASRDVMGRSVLDILRQAPEEADEGVCVASFL